MQFTDKVEHYKYHHLLSSWTEASYIVLASTFEKCWKKLKNQNVLLFLGIVWNDNNINFLKLFNSHCIMNNWEVSAFLVQLFLSINSCCSTDSISYVDSEIVNMLVQLTRYDMHESGMATLSQLESLIRWRKSQKKSSIRSPISFLVQ